MSPLVSIIIPVYNDERYIARALKSALSQTYKNIEIIVVDDGSTDRTPNICDDYALGDNRIKVIHKKNEGVSVARNTGIDLSQGDYICFVDSDDVVLPNFVKETLTYALKTDADMIMGAVLPTSNIDIKIEQTVNPKYRLYIDDEIKKIKMAFTGDIISLSNNGYLGRGPCCKLYSSKCMKGLRFNSRLTLCEDRLFNYQFAQNSDKICLVDQIWYLYYSNNDSASSRYKENSLIENEEYLNQKIKLIDLRDKELFHSYINEIRGMLIGYLFLQYFFNSKCPLKYREKRKLLNDIRVSKPWVYICDAKWRKKAGLLAKIDSYLFTFRMYSILHYKNAIITKIKEKKRQEDN